MLTSCSEEVEYATPVPTPEFWQIFISPTLSGFTEELQTCLTDTNVTLILDEGYYYRESQEYSLVLLWGDMAVSGDAYVLLQDSFMVVVNPDNPLLEISLNQLMDIYSGNISSWEQVNPSLTGLGEIQTWAYPPGVDIEKEQSNRILPFEEIRPDAGIAPNAESMLEMVRDTPGSIGLLPGIWIDESIKQISILGEISEHNVPVLMIAPAEIRENYAGILSCFQKNLDKKP